MRVDEALVPNKRLTRDEMVALQREIAERAVFEDDLSTVETVVGVDQAFADDGDIVVSAAVFMHDGETVETATARSETQIPYIPGLLAFREGQVVFESLRAFETTPDIVLIDGSGRIHPRQAGLATHIGVTLNLPTVGVAKSLLCGKQQRSVERLEEGERVEIVADDRVNAPNGTVTPRTDRFNRDT
jgi:deoxyribonuclease V